MLSHLLQALLHSIFALFLTLTLLPSSAEEKPRSERGLQNDLIFSSSTKEVATLLQIEQSTRLPQRIKNEILLKQCQSGDNEGIIELLIEAGFAPAAPLSAEEEEEGSVYYEPMEGLFNNDDLPQDKILPLAEKLYQAGASFTPYAFNQVCRTLSIENIKFALERGAAIDGRADELVCPLAIICAERSDEQEVCNQQLRCVAYLLDQGAKADGRKQQELKPLYIAATLGRADLIKLLLKHGASVNIRGKEGLSPIHDACSPFSNLECLNLLLEHGANPHTVSDQGFTPLMAACLGGHTAIIQRLFDLGVDASRWSKSHTIFGYWIPALPSIAIAAIGASMYDNADIFFIVVQAQQLGVQILIIILCITLPMLILQVIITPFAALALIAKKFHTARNNTSGAHCKKDLFDNLTR